MTLTHQYHRKYYSNSESAPDVLSQTTFKMSVIHEYDIAEYFWKFNDHKLKYMAQWYKTVLYHLEIGITMYWDFDLKSLIMNFLSFFSFKHL